MSTVVIEPSWHARLSASAAERWMNCYGATNLAAKRPAGPTSFPAAEGTFAHAVAASCLNTGLKPKDWLGEKVMVEGHAITCDADMAEGVQFYLDTLAGLRLPQCAAEVSLHAALQKLDPDLGGTADYVTYDLKAGLLRVFDFKYGAGTYVAIDDNRQLKIYALGALLALGVPIQAVEVYIVQPRYEGATPVRVSKFDAFELMDFMADVKHCAEETRKPDAPLAPGAWCKKTFCPNADVCPALEAMQHALVKLQFSDVAPFDSGALGKALNQIPLVEERIAAMKAFAYNQSLAGVKIPGWKLVEKRPRRHWNDEPGVIEWAKKRAIDPFVVPEVKSPAQLEKGMKKAEKTELAMFVVSLSSGTTLVPESDARPAVSNQITVDDFEAIGGPEGAPKQLAANNLFE